eukprot:3003381-Alexandrium_andersonii.AAC.1
MSTYVMVVVEWRLYHREGSEPNWVVRACGWKCLAMWERSRACATLLGVSWTMMVRWREGVSVGWVSLGLGKAAQVEPRDCQGSVE